MPSNDPQQIRPGPTLVFLLLYIADALLAFLPPVGGATVLANKKLGPHELHPVRLWEHDANTPIHVAPRHHAKGPVEFNGFRQASGHHEQALRNTHAKILREVRKFAEGPAVR